MPVQEGARDADGDTDPMVVPPRVGTFEGSEGPTDVDHGLLDDPGRRQVVGPADWLETVAPA
jgi:hypothetical protein